MAIGFEANENDASTNVNDAPQGAPTMTQGNNAVPPPPAGGTQPQQPQQQTTFFKPTGDNCGWGELMSQSGVTSSGAAGNVADMEKFIETFEMQFEPHKGKIMRVAEPTRMAMPALVVYLETAQGVTAFTIMMASCAYRSFAPESVTQNNQQFSVDVPASHAHNKSYLDVISGAVAPGKPFRSVGFCVIHSIDDMKNEDSLKELVSAVGLTAVRAINAAIERTILSMKTIANLNAELVPFMAPVSDVYLDPMRRPTAADATILIDACKKRNNNNTNTNFNLNEDGTQLPIATGSVMMDFIYNPEQISNIPGKPVLGYLPRIRITSCDGIDPKRGSANESPVTAFMVAAAISQLALNNRWTALNPKLELFGWEHNPFPTAAWQPKELDLGGDTLYNNLEMIASSYCYPEAEICIDVEQGGRNGWWGASLEKSVGDPKVNQMLVDALNAATDNNFSKHMPAGESLFLNRATYHAGVYSGAQGEQRDLREINYLKMLGMLKMNAVTEIGEFADSFTPGAATNQNVDKRRKMLEQATQGYMTITGLGTTLTFNPKAINAFLEAMKNVQVSVRPEGPLFHAHSSIRGAGYVPVSGLNGNVARDVFSQTPATTAYAGGGIAYASPYSTPVTVR